MLRTSLREKKIMDLDINMRKAHVERVGKGKCQAKLTAPFNKIIHSIDRMGNCCINIVDAVQGDTDLKYFVDSIWILQNRLPITMLGKLKKIKA